MAETQKTYSMRLSAKANTAPYQCLVEASTAPDVHTTRELAKIIIEQYTSQKQALRRWRKLPPFTIPWTDMASKPPKVRKSALLRFDWLVDHIVKHRKLEHSLLGLYPPEKAQRNWMDADRTLFGHYTPCNQEPESLRIKLPLSLGNDFPVTPAIDREGFATSSPQLHLQRGLLNARHRVIQESPAFVPQVIDRNRGQHAQYMMGQTPPLAALMEFTTLYVTIVDITLMQAYYAAFYAPKETRLTFVQESMGAATGRNMKDKLKWVRTLSGNDLNAQAEIDTFNQMKAVRNHLTHFDPPCFAVSIEDVAGWLSKTSALAWLLIKIRLCLGIPVSGPLVQMAMLPPVLAVPRDPEHPRHPPPKDTGYSSSTWKGEHPHRGRDPLRIPTRLVTQFEPISKRASHILGRDCPTSELIAAVLAQHVSELNSLDDLEFMIRLKRLMYDTKDDI